MGGEGRGNFHIGGPMGTFEGTQDPLCADLKSQCEHERHDDWQNTIRISMTWNF